jgi:hypothetical protein
MLGFGLKLAKNFSKTVSNGLSAINNYFRPDGISAYKRPDGSNYIRP